MIRLSRGGAGGEGGWGAAGGGGGLSWGGGCSARTFFSIFKILCQIENYIVFPGGTFVPFSDPLTLWSSLQRNLELITLNIDLRLLVLSLFLAPSMAPTAPRDFFFSCKPRAVHPRRPKGTAPPTPHAPPPAAGAARRPAGPPRRTLVSALANAGRCRTRRGCVCTLYQSISENVTDARLSKSGAVISIRGRGQRDSALPTRSPSGQCDAAEPTATRRAFASARRCFFSSCASGGASYENTTILARLGGGAHVYCARPRLVARQRNAHRHFAPAVQ